MQKNHVLILCVSRSVANTVRCTCISTLTLILMLQLATVHLLRFKDSHTHTHCNCPSVLLLYFYKDLTSTRHLSDKVKVHLPSVSLTALMK